MRDLMKRLLEMEIALSSPWAEEARKAHDEIERLTAVLDAAREHINAHLALPETKRATEVDEDYAYDQGALWMAREILRILDAGKGQPESTSGWQCHHCGAYNDHDEPICFCQEGAGEGGER